MNVVEINPLTLPSLPLSERKQLPSCSAIYFVMQGDHILYIGQTNILHKDGQPITEVSYDC